MADKTPDTPSKKPTYDTALSPSEEKQFESWKQQYAPNDTGADYDLRGAFKAGVKPDGDRGHFPDTFKKPNHPTFSVESQYSKGDEIGGQWITKDGKTVFVPSPWNLKQTPADKLQEYFKRVEPDAVLQMPEPPPQLPAKMLAPLGSLEHDIQTLLRLP